MAIQTIYTQVDNAKIEPCKKGKPVPPIQIPLLRSNYLGEYRTQAEKDKVLKNLGILGVTNKYTYPSDSEVDSYKDIQSIQQALDYCIRLIQSYEESDLGIKALEDDIKTLKGNITTLQESITQNTDDITTINNSITAINKSIAEFDQKLQDLNVDDKITKRINQHLENSKTIELVDNTLEVKVSKEENNQITIKDDGLYTSAGTYTSGTTGSSPYTVGGITQGTTAESLNGKSISDIIDLMLFPTYVRDLVYPTLSFSYVSNIVEVGGTVIKPTLTFTQNDAGAKTDETSTLTYGGSTYTSAVYLSIGTYIYKGSVSYEAGDYLVDNKGETTNKRVEAGTIETTTSTVATYPWYAGNTSSVSKQALVAFNQDSGVRTISLSGTAVIKLPGSKSTLTSFKVDGGLGYLDVDLTGWTESTEQINGFTYKVWTKNDSYASVLPHQIQFKLVQ